MEKIEMELKTTERPQPGDRIIYQYKHWLNSKQFTRITKYGVFIRNCKKKYDGWTLKCIVQIDGNKNPSTVWIAHVFKQTD